MSDDDRGQSVALADLLHRGSAREPILFVGEEKFSRGDLTQSADGLTDALSSLGVAAGAVVASCLPAPAAMVTALFGTWRSGASFAPLNPRLTDDELSSMVAEITPAAVLVAFDDERAGTIFAGITVIEIDDALTWRVLSARRAPTPKTDVGIALVLYTSGTTARPKPVLLRRDKITSAMTAVVRSLGRPHAAPVRTDVKAMPNLIAFPFFLWSGIYSACFALLQSSLIVAMTRFEPHRFAEIVRTHEIRSVVLAPAMIIELLETDDIDLSSLRFVRNGTAPLPISIAIRFEERFGTLVLNGYGQTELGGEVAGWSGRDVREFGRSKRGAVGRAHPGVIIRVVDDNGDKVAADVDGEVVVKSPFAMAGYLEAGDLDRFTADGLIRTGDLGHLDEDGFLWLTGRRSDVINRSGLKVFPQQVEDVLRGDPAVVDVAVAAVPDARVGQVPWAFVILRAGHRNRDVVEKRLEALARERLAAYKVPAGFSYVRTFPRNDAGKVLRRALTRHASEGETADPA